MNAYQWLTGNMKQSGSIKVALDDDARFPTKGFAADAGFDLYSREDAVIEPGKSWVFNTGVHMAIPEGICGLIVGKSGLNVVYDAQSSGLIDSGYTGAIHIKLYNHGEKTLEIKKGQKISQIVLLPIIMPVLCLVKSLEATQRGDGGFGSTGKF